MWVHVLCVKISRHLLKVEVSPVSYVSPGFHAQINLESHNTAEQIAEHDDINTNNSTQLIYYIDATYLLFFFSRFDRNTYGERFYIKCFINSIFQFNFIEITKTLNN